MLPKRSEKKRVQCKKNQLKTEITRKLIKKNANSERVHFEYNNDAAPQPSNKLPNMGKNNENSASDQENIQEVEVSEIIKEQSMGGNVHLIPIPNSKAYKETIINLPESQAKEKEAVLQETKYFPSESDGMNLYGRSITNKMSPNIANSGITILQAIQPLNPGNQSHNKLYKRLLV